jgi:hypothetical protein
VGFGGGGGTFWSLLEAIEGEGMRGWVLVDIGSGGKRDGGKRVSRQQPLIYTKQATMTDDVLRSTLLPLRIEGGSAISYFGACREDFPYCTWMTAQ